jgi:hypothetical protein
MSIKVNLHFQTKIDLEFLSQGVHLRLIRLLGTVQLKTSTAWSPEARVIIDTGNPVTIIPYSIWSQADVRILIQGKTKLYGLGSDEADGLSGQLAEVTLVFKDPTTTSPPIRCKGHILDDDGAPFLIGFEDILASADLACSYKSHTAWLEI